MPEVLENTSVRIEAGFGNVKNLLAAARETAGNVRTIFEDSKVYTEKASVFGREMVTPEGFRMNFSEDTSRLDLGQTARNFGSGLKDDFGKNVVHETITNSENLAESTKTVLNDIVNSDNVTKEQLQGVKDLTKQLNNTPQNPLSKEAKETISSIPRGERPSPESYLPQNYINLHNQQFKDGVSKFQSDFDRNNNIEKYGENLGPKGMYVLPKKIADSIVQASGGEPRVLEDLLGLEKGSLGENPLRFDMEPSADMLSIPSGNELGANSQWLAGGYTSGGIPEASIGKEFSFANNEFTSSFAFGGK